MLAEEIYANFRPTWKWLMQSSMNFLDSYLLMSTSRWPWKSLTEGVPQSGKVNVLDYMHQSSPSSLHWTMIWVRKNFYFVRQWKFFFGTALSITHSDNFSVKSDRIIPEKFYKKYKILWYLKSTIQNPWEVVRTKYIYIFFFQINCITWKNFLKLLKKHLKYS